MRHLPQFVARLVIVCALGVATPETALAQQARPSIFAVDTVAAIDESVSEAGDFSTGVVFDSVVSADLSRGFQGIIRPIAQRRGGTWNNQIWMATLRYERSSPVFGIRVDAGLIPSPIGLASLSLRPHTNPTIFQPSSLFSALPALQIDGPRINLLGAMYPFGGQVTFSGALWDVRAAIIDMSPLRPREVFADANPPRFTNAVVGGGVTPFVGLRIGAAVAHGGWLRAGETTTTFFGNQIQLSATDLDATVITVESEFSFRYTKLTAEYVRDHINTSNGRVVARGWFVQGQQTLAPRWFVAGRIERLSAPAIARITMSGLFDLPSGPVTSFSTSVRRTDQNLMGFEGTVGYRVTPEITFRLGHRARRAFSFTAQGFDHQTAVSVVWWRRWL